MFSKHVIINDKEEDTLFLFIDLSSEFSVDFNIKNQQEKIKNIYHKVTKYIRDQKINFNKGKVFLVVGSIIIGTLLISNLEYPNKEKTDYQYVEAINLFQKPAENKETPSTESSTIQEEKTSITKESNESKQETTTSSEKEVSKSSITSSPQTTNSAPTQEATSSGQAEQPTTTNETMVTVYRSNGTVEQITLENYIIGVVAAEMPASFNIEALKAQSVLARTYALKRMAANQVLTDTTSTQVYKDQSQLQTLWGSSYQTYYNKIKNAVTATNGQSLTYNGSYIEAVYHSTSNGQTEDAQAVWGNSYPYLISVDSHWDLQASSYLRETPKDFNIISSILGIPFNETTSIEVLSRTSGNRINQIKIGDVIYSGVQLRNLLGLRSADFDIVITNGIATFVTKGYGHGVGMSQYGANGMANEGYSYQQILSHYYPNTTLK